MSFTYQKWNKLESEQRIINTLNDGDRSFGELLKLTELSKPVLSERLRSLIEQGKIESVAEPKIKRFLYHLNYGSLDKMEEVHLKIHGLSKYILTGLAKFAKDSSISDEEYRTKLYDGIASLLSLKIYAVRVAPKSAQREWLKNALGLEFMGIMPKLFPENRNVLPGRLKGTPSKDIKDVDSLLEYLDMIIEKMKSVSS